MAQRQCHLSNFPRLVMRVMRVLSGLLLVVSVVACASGPRMVFHGFTFDGRDDHWMEGIDLLRYSYGDQYHMVRADLDDPNYFFYGLNHQRIAPHNSVTGEMPVADFLEVKWRVQATGQVIHEKVDLRPLLPIDMTDHKVTFVIDGPQLYVYVVTPLPRPSFSKVNQRTWLSAHLVTYPIFPQRIFPTPD